MFLISRTKPGIKSGELPIEALCAELAYPECCGFGKGRTFAIERRAHGMRNL